MPTTKKRVSVVLPAEMVAQLKSRYGDVSPSSVRQAIADFFQIENSVEHGGARYALHNFECHDCGHKWRDTQPTIECSKCGSEEFWVYENDA